MRDDPLKSEFKKRALMVSAVVHEVSGIREALGKAVDLCIQKYPCQNLMPGVQQSDSRKRMAAPNLGPDDFAVLKNLCHTNDIELIRENMRLFPGGIDMGITLADFGIADTGTLVLNSDSEDTRLATMLCETHVAVLDGKNIRRSAIDMADELNKMIEPPWSYTAFITGASRTADIERVLALGVHGPLELTIMLITGK